MVWIRNEDWVVVGVAVLEVVVVVGAVVGAVVGV